MQDESERKVTDGRTKKRGRKRNPESPSYQWARFYSINWELHSFSHLANEWYTHGEWGFQLYKLKPCIIQFGRADGERKKETAKWPTRRSRSYGHSSATELLFASVRGEEEKAIYCNASRYCTLRLTDPWNTASLANTQSTRWSRGERKSRCGQTFLSSCFFSSPLLFNQLKC